MRTTLPNRTTGGVFIYITPRREVTFTRPVCGLAFFMPRKGGLQMADDKKNIPEAVPPAEAPAPTVENAVVPEQPSPGPALTDAEAVILEHEGRRRSLKWARPCLIPPTLLPTPRWRSLPLPKSPRPKRSRRSRPLPVRTIPSQHIPARWWILPPPVTRRPRRRKRRSSRSRPRKRTRPPSPAEVARPRMARPLPIRPSRPNLGQKVPKQAHPGEACRG